MSKYADKCHLYVVYALPNEEYVGCTKNVTDRMFRHRNNHSRNTDEWFILSVHTNRADALKVEREYHRKGYDGVNKKTVMGCANENIRLLTPEDANDIRRKYDEKCYTYRSLAAEYGVNHNTIRDIITLKTYNLN